MARLVFGVGVNDANYVVQPTIGGIQEICPFYARWHNMLLRCYYPGYQVKYPAYVGCNVVPEWWSFSAFKIWMQQQDWQGKHMDKDLLGDGKTYSSEACVFISQPLNKFLTDSAAARGPYPTGVTFIRNRFIARVGTGVRGKRLMLGRFKTPEEAHLAWATKKAEMAFDYANQQTDQRIADALRSFGEGLLWAKY